MGTYTPGWLQWAAELPIPIGYTAAALMIPSYIFWVLWIPFEIEVASKTIKTD